MRDASVAQRILEFVMARERAAAIAGDLIEDAATRGTRVLWPAARIAARHVLQEFWDASCLPAMFAGQGAKEWAYFLGLALMVTPWVPALRSAYRPIFGFHGLLLPCLMAAPLLIGWRVGARAGERAVASGLALFALVAAMGVGDILSGVLVGPSRELYPAPMAAFFCLAGSICQRLHTMLHGGLPAPPSGTGAANV